MAENGWFAVPPSGSENVYKIYAESFREEEHLRRILEETQGIVSDALAAPPRRGNRGPGSGHHHHSGKETVDMGRYAGKPGRCGRNSSLGEI